MPQLPPVPAWSGLHPLIIHFPIALLLIAPLFLAIAGIMGWTKGRAYLISALILLVLGTVSVFVAVESGEAAGKLAERTPAINAVLEHHQELAERTQVTFTVLTLALGLWVVIAHFVPRLQRRGIAAVAIAILLAGSAYGALSLADTAHNGGRLVHEHGVQAMVAPSPSPPPAQEAKED